MTAPRLLAATLVLLAATGARAADVPVILRGGAIYTLDAAHPWARTLVIAGGRIAYVGDDAGAKAFKGRTVALRGRMVLPGFHDAHAHPMNSGMMFLRCGLAGLKTVRALSSAVRACDAAEKEDWLIGYGWSPAEVAADRALLDRLVPDRPAYLATEDGFTAWVNSKALAAAGIDPKTSGGLVKDDDLQRVRRVRPQPNQATYREAFRRWSALANSLGITSVFDAAATGEMVDAYHAADAAHELRLRVVAAQLVDPDRGPDQVDEMAARRDRSAGPRLRAHAAKIFLDGELEMHTAAVLADYADAPGARGKLYVEPAALDALVRRLDAAGFDIHMHVMGDGAARAGLDAIERAEQANGARDRRHQLAHLALVDPSDVPRFAGLGVTANFSPLWFQADDPAAAATDAVLDPARRSRLYPIASIAAAGGRIVASSDWPSTALDPLEGIQTGVTRRPLDGRKPARQPDQRMRLDAMLAAYTRDAAWVAREDATDGIIAVGKAADLVVLDRNLFRIDATAIHKARVLLTLIDGEPVYRDKRSGWGK